MKRMAVVLAAMGISAAAYAYDSSELMGESAYGYSMDDPYTASLNDEIYVVEEYILVPSDTIVLIPVPDEEQSDSALDFPG